MNSQTDQLTGLALQHHQAGKLVEARALYLKILNQTPNHPIAPHMLGLIALAGDQLNEAAQYFEQALIANPNNSDAHGNLGLAFMGLGRIKEAARALEYAVSIDPTDSVALFNLGLTYSDLGRLEEAQKAYEKALAQDPQQVKTLNNLGNVLWDRGMLDEAEQRYENALALEPDNAEVHKTIGFLQLLRGDFAKGWENYAWRLKEADCPLQEINYPQPQWQGEDLEGKTILVYHEQGLGDVIQFVRYLPLLKGRGARVLFEVQAPLYDLMVASDLAHMVFKTGETPPAFDCHIPLLELPRIFGTDLDTIPSATPYLTVPGEKVREWQGRLAADGGFKVGIVWTGNPIVASNPKRSIDPHLLKPLGQIPGVSLYSLQVGRDSEAQQVFGGAITDLSPLLKDYTETAAAIMNLDLIVSTCTSPIHMAGALGRPCWALLCKWPDWRWLIDRGDCPWYPSMQLYRQQEAGDWSDTIEQVRNALMDKVKS